MTENVRKNRGIPADFVTESLQKNLSAKRAFRLVHVFNLTRDLWQTGEVVMGDHNYSTGDPASSSSLSTSLLDSFSARPSALRASCKDS